MRDLVPVFAIVGMIVFAMIPLLVRWARSYFVGWARGVRRGFFGGREDGDAAALEDRLSLALENRTVIRLDNGRIVPKCRHCDLEATERVLKWVRNEGIVDLVRRFFGAPARVRAAHDADGDIIYCQSHAAMAKEEYRIELARSESEKASLERDWEVRRTRFQQTGVFARLDEHIKKHDLEVKKADRRRQKSETNAKVVPISGRTGTE